MPGQTVLSPPKRRRAALALPRGVAADDVRAQLGRMLASEPFARSQRLSDFLRYVVEAALGDRLDRITEAALAADVYERNQRYDPRIDPIVRVEAGRLRNKIREYYATAGAADPLWLGLAQRGYRPVVRRSAPSPPLAQSPPSAPAGTPAGAKPSLAVLPVENLTGEPALEPICRDLTQRLIEALSGGDWAVAERAAVRRYRGHPTDVREIARELAVGRLLEGSLQQADGIVRLRLRLLDGASGLAVWADSLDEPVSDPNRLPRKLASRTLDAFRSH